MHVAILITGGAGFIGSYLVDNLLPTNNVHVLDNLSNGNIEYIKEWKKNNNFQFFKLDLVKDSLELDNYDTIFHLAANPDVRTSYIDPKLHLEQNVTATFNILEYARKHDVNNFVFTSSSTVYGEADVIPTPEDYGPLKPISIYGASKLASESLICSYAYTYGFKAIIYRLANVIGGRSTHGVIYDFINKLKKDHTKLEILGDGKQTKSYIHVSDCINAILKGLETNKQVDIFNVGSNDYVDVISIAEAVIDALGLNDVKFVFNDQYGGRGWKGDVKVMLLDISKLKALGWNIKYGSLEAVKETLREILRNDSHK